MMANDAGLMFIGKALTNWKDTTLGSTCIRGWHPLTPMFRGIT